MNKHEKYECVDIVDTNETTICIIQYLLFIIFPAMANCHLNGAIVLAVVLTYFT